MRKFKFTICIITVVIIVLTSLSQVISQNNQNMKKGFYLGPMSHYFLNVLETDSHNQWYRDLSYNMMQSYCAHLDDSVPDWQSTSQRDGGFFEGIDNYRVQMQQVIEKWNALAHDNSLIFEREKILRPAYGQRFTYQAEDPGIGWHTKFPAYGYDSTNVTGLNVDDSIGIRSRYCKVGRDTAGFIVKGLYENCSQTNDTTIVPNGTNSSGHDRLYSDIKQPEYNMRWFVKPRMRVDSLYAKAHQNDTVVIVYVKNFSGNLIDSFMIKCINFLDISDPLNPKYDGRYLENFHNLPTNYNNLSVRADSLALGRGTKPFDSSHVDYQVKWLGKVDVWLDYVRVDDSWAHYLFTDTWDNEPSNTANIWKFHRRIKEEVEAFSSTQGLGYFWVDEVQYPNLECIGEVNRLVKQYSNNTMSLLFITDPNAFMGWPAFRASNSSSTVDHANWDICINKAIDCGALSDIMITQWFPFYFTLKYPDVLPEISDYYFIHDWVKRANNYYQYTYVPDQGVQPTISWLVRQHRYFIKKAKEKGLIYGVINQINSDEGAIKDDGTGWGIREPTNEEISLILNTSMVHGAKVMLEFSYTTRLQDTGKHKYNWGLTSPDPFLGKRDSNYYGQRKWDFVSALNKKLKQTGDYMYPLNSPNEHLVHDKTLTVNTVSYQAYCDECGYANYDYVNEIRSLAPLISGANPCVSEGVYNDHYDCPDERYWELGFFKTNQNSSNQNDKSKYLYAVNKRTYPRNTLNNLGDVRILKIRFDTTNLQSYHNWVIKEAITDSVLAVFNKTNTNYITVASFEPGEGKLLKIAPVMQEGGTLAGNETFSGNVTCNGMIYSNGHNITISPNTTITFSDSAGIEMNGGCFVSNVNADNVEPVTLTGKTETTFWKGITLIGCDSIGVYNTNVSNIKANDTAKAFSIINSYKVNFRRNTINANSNSGGIQAVYNNFSDNPIVFNVRDCNFNMNQSGYSAISVFSNASVTLPIITEWCTFNSQNDTSNAVMLTEVTGGAIKNNIFSNFGKSVVLMYSTVDLYGNIIIGKDNSQGILCLSESNVSLSPNSGLYLGGYNYIRNYGNSASNIYSNNSNFNINNGHNNFDISDIDNSKHLTGTFGGQQQLSVNAEKNCFHKDSITNIEANHNVTWESSTDPVNFIFTSYSCELTPPPGDFFVFQYEGYNDTIYRGSGGEGGGINPNKIINIEENVYKSLRDTININLRKRNYLTVEEKTKQILTQFPDSLESIGMVQKLYMASLSLDSTKIGITKTFLENIIVNNTQNPGLVKRAFYFIQKCKVKLGQYQSALDGFQYIMTQNSYTYEGLVASWDYAATYLLMGTGGSYNGDFEVQSEELNTPADTLLNRMTKRDINTNKSTNTNSNNTSIEQITKTFYEKIKNVTKDNKSIQEAKIKTLEKKIETTKNKNEKNDAAKELATMKQINEVVKVKKPNTVMTHVAILNNDIKKVFGIGKGSKDESRNNLIPTTYTLYQNYPNPFNPVTKIAFDLPKDAKVKLVIYDILGREMKTLVNNEFKTAGKYITEFNGSFLSSGIYFARILVNDGKEFVSVKKMVLLK